MTEYRVPGDQDHPEWWTEQDQVILRGAVAELGALPEAPYHERVKDRMEYVPIVVPLAPRRRWAREIGAWITIVAVAALVVVLMSWAGERPAPPPCAGDPAGCADFVTVPAPAAGPR